MFSEILSVVFKPSVLKTKVAIFISGRGSNLEVLLKKVEQKKLPVHIQFVFSNRPNVKGLNIARRYGVRTITFTTKQFSSFKEYETKLLQECQKNKVEYIICAGYLKIIRSTLLNVYPQHIFNIHPSLLPSFKGLRAQEQALVYGVRYTGCTVHFVDAGVDTGKIIAQFPVKVYRNDTEASLSKRILKAEHNLYWQAIKMVLEQKT